MTSRDAWSNAQRDFTSHTRCFFTSQLQTSISRSTIFFINLGFAKVTSNPWFCLLMQWEVVLLMCFGSLSCCYTTLISLIPGLLTYYGKSSKCWSSKTASDHYTATTMFDSNLDVLLKCSVGFTPYGAKHMPSKNFYFCPIGKNCWLIYTCTCLAVYRVQSAPKLLHCSPSCPGAIWQKQGCNALVPLEPLTTTSR